MTKEAVRTAPVPHRSATGLPPDEELLVRAAELVARGWCQKALAADEKGRQVEPWCEGACRWSPLGALTRAWYEGRGQGREPFETAYGSLALATGGRLEEWNAAPWRTKRHVLSAFARARAYLPQAREQVDARAQRSGDNERGPEPRPTP